MPEIAVVQSSELARIAGFYASVGHGGGVLRNSSARAGRLTAYLSSGQRVLAMRRSAPL